MKNDLFDNFKLMSNDRLNEQLLNRGVLNKANAIAAVSLRRDCAQVFASNLETLEGDTDIISPPYSVGDLAKGALSILGVKKYEDPKTKRMVAFLETV